MAGLTKGIIHSFVTGSHGRPQVALEAEAYWREPQGREWSPSVTSILPTRLMQKPGSGLFALDDIAGLAMQAKAAKPDLYVALVVESTMSPGVPDAARSRHKEAWSYVRDARVVAGGDPDKLQGITTRIGASTLSSLFSDSVETRGLAYLSNVRGIPVAADSRLVAVSFSSYREGDDVLPLSSVKSALATATDIRSTGKPGEQVLLSTPSEAIAASLMLALWFAQANPPPVGVRLGERRTLSRSGGGVA